jgi:hypothetical protein
MYDVLRPGLVRFSGYPEASAAVADILEREAAASASGLEPIDEEEEEDSDEVGVGGGGRGSGLLELCATLCGVCLLVSVTACVS